MPAKTILITAGAQGIGRGVAQRFLRGGWRVVLFDLDAEALAETREELGSPERTVPDPGRAAKLNGTVRRVGGGLGLGDPPGEECPPTRRAQHPRAA